LGGASGHDPNVIQDTYSDLFNRKTIIQSSDVSVDIDFPNYNNPNNYPTYLSTVSAFFQKIFTPIDYKTTCLIDTDCNKKI